MPSYDSKAIYPGGRRGRGGSILKALAAAILITSLPASAQPPPLALPPLAGATAFTIFVRSIPIGTEQIAVSRTAEGWTIVSSGRIGAPIDAVARRVQVRYTSDWHPVELLFEGTVRGEAQ